MKLVISDDEELKKADDKYEYFNQDKQLRKAYDAYIKWKMGYKTDLEIAEEKERKEGERTKAIETAKTLIRLGIDIDTIIKATKLTKEEIEKLSD